MFRSILGCGFVALVWMSCHDPASTPARLRPPVYFDADLSAPAVAMRRASLPGTVTSVDTRRGTARFVWTHDDAPPSVLVTPSHRRRGATSAPAVAALWHAEHHADHWGLDPDALSTVEVAQVHDLGRGAIIVKLRQKIGGIEVARTALSVIMDRDLKLVALSGGLNAAARPTPSMLAPAMHLSGHDALERAFEDAGAAPPDLAPMRDRGGYQRFGAPGIAGPARVRAVFYPVGTQLVPAWETEVLIRDGKKIAGYRHAFAADDGRLLMRYGLTHDDFTYRVYADATGDFRPADGPLVDYSPHPTGNPDGFHPAFSAPNLITIDGFNHNPGGGHDPWLPVGATITNGNNINAYADLDAFDGLSGGDVQPTTTAPGVFDRTYDLTKEPADTNTQIMAAVTNLFYITNWLHDYWYDSGFNEAAGNAQQSNFGRGGVEGDVLLAEGQDSSGTDNANMSVPADGESPRMQMYTWDAPAGGASPDGTIDNPIIEHEWGHYLHLRLVNCGSNQCGAMSEGWADFDALLTTVRAADNLDGTYGLGAYALQSFSANPAYFGIRRYPYSTNKAKSPLTFRFMQDGVAMPVGPAYTDVGFLQGAENYEFHDAGEIWCAMVWEGFIDTLKLSKGATPKYTFEEARRKYADYVVAGMIAAPVEPTFTDQKDAILAAVAASDAQDFVLIAHSFARRGFGTGAISPPLDSFDGSGVVESLVVTGALSVDSISVAEDDATSCDHDGILDVGEIGTVTVTVRNTGADVLTAPVVAIANGTPGVSFPTGSTASLPAIPPFGTATGTIKIRLDETETTPTQLDFQVQLSDASAALSPVVGTGSVSVNLDVVPTSSAGDDFEAPSIVWTANTGWARAVDASTPANHVARVTVAPSGDHHLQSPGLQVMAGAHLMIPYMHRFDFATVGTNQLDGGVVEISTNGVDFSDVTMFAANPHYTGTITGTGNPLATRMGYGGHNPSFPGFDNVMLDLGTGFGGQTVFFRFRAGGDTIANTSVWDVDQFAAAGVTNTPFPTLETETGSCLPGSRPIAVAADVVVQHGQPGMLDGSASHDPDGGSLTFEWTQMFGVAIDLSSTTVAQPTFTAPDSQLDRVAGFQLVVRDPDNRVSIPVSMRVTIKGPVMVDAGVDAPPDATVGMDASDTIDAAQPDAGTPLTGNGGGGCCDTGGDARGGILLALGVMVAMRRRKR